MSRFTITQFEKGRCRIRHSKNQSQIETDLPPEYGGKGRSFSSTDLVAAAVGTCYLTTIETILEREGVGTGEVAVEVRKELSQQPKKIKAVRLILHLPVAPSEKLKKMLLKAIDLCPVKRSLASDIESTLELKIKGLKP